MITDLYVCACDATYPGLPHHPDCPARAQFDALRARLKELERERTNALMAYCAPDEPCLAPDRISALLAACERGKE